MKYLVVGFLIFLACKATLTPEQKEIENACLKLEDTLKIFWKYDSLKQHHIDNPKSPFFPVFRIGVTRLQFQKFVATGIAFHQGVAKQVSFFWNTVELPLLDRLF